MTTAGDDKVLILFRHGKAGEGSPDERRELTGRGRRDSRAAGSWLREQGLGPELVLCSPAVRTRQTWDQAVEGGACGERVQYPEHLYNARPDAVLQEVRESAGEAQVVLVVGHNPTMALLASQLCEGDGSGAAHEVLASGFPTASVAVLRYACPWGELGTGTARLERCHVCRG
jgi:phosphohistidine phosphatase